jgi:putative transcriptional regulator
MRVQKLCFLIMLAASASFATLEHFHALRQTRVKTPTSLHSSNLFAVSSHNAAPIFAPAQSTNVSDLAAGKLLVASRSVGDSNFARAVVLLIHYDEKQVEGLILNRRTTAPLSMLLKDLEPGKDVTGSIYIGGPVEPRSLFSLLKLPKQQEGTESVFGNVYLIRSKTLFDQTVSGHPDASVLHVYLGCAEWTPDQLDQEVTLGAWFIFPPSTEAVFTDDPDTLWSQMIQKAEARIANSQPDSLSPQLYTLFWRERLHSAN